MLAIFAVLGALVSIALLWVGIHTVAEFISTAQHKGKRK